MKKLLALVLSLCLVLSLAACGGKKADDTADNDNTASDTTTLGAMQVEQVNTAILPGIDLPTAAAAQALTANEEALQGGTRGKAERTAFTQAALAALGAE